MAKVLDVIWGRWEQKYFSENQKKDSTDGQITARAQAVTSLRSNGSRECAPGPSKLAPFDCASVEYWPHAPIETGLKL
jgi:hypothetical protein